MATNPGLSVRADLGPRSGTGTAIVWFRNDLRVHDNEALRNAWRQSEAVLPVYIFDPRTYATTPLFGFPKTGAGQVAEVHVQKETTDEEVRVEKGVERAVCALVLASKALPSGEVRRPARPKMEWTWGATMYHFEDLPFTPSHVPDVYTQFRKMPTNLGPLPENILQAVGGCGDIPPLSDFGLAHREQDRLKVYKDTRNGMLGADYSSKFSPWLATGTLSPRFIAAEVKRYERERVANTSTYWLLFELIWRDYFRFLSVKYGNAIFHLGGPRRVKNLQWSQNTLLFEAYPLVDANMRELATTGFMSNRGRQIVCSFLVRDMGIDWRMGAEWFETCLLDYDPCSNYGNWTYGAGTPPDPDPNPKFLYIPKQYVAHWIPELKSLPKNHRHFPHKLSPSEKAMHGFALNERGSSGAYPSPIVQLKFGNSASSTSGGGVGTGQLLDFEEM
eukprot:jgi/Mesen1/5145/ME000255S04126